MAYAHIGPYYSFLFFTLIDIYLFQDPLILSCVLSNISALFPYITHEPNILPTVLDKVSGCQYNINVTYDV